MLEKLPKKPVALCSLLVLGALALTELGSAVAAPPSPVLSSAAIDSGERCQFLPHSGKGLDSRGFTLFNWNIKKGSIANWDRDLLSLAADADLVLIQEATKQMETPRFVEVDEHWSFSEGYSSGELVSGVATISSVQPMEQCRLLTVEPWLRTPKATMVTRFAIEGSSDTLLVINTHMVNFTLGHAAFREQLAEVEQLLLQHSGPVVFSGDFNTWRPARYEILEKMTARFGLNPIAFNDDNRTKFFGSTVDHVFVGGLSVQQAMTFEVESSDHNPMSVSLML